MPEFSLSYREVIPDHKSQDTWKEIALTTGGTQSTLQDIKVTEKANGYCYKDPTKHYTRNRFIYWRINYDILELVEHSLDINLTSNKVRYRFTDTPILNGISVHETDSHVVILVPTVCSVHRLTFPHPKRFHRQEEYLGSHPDLAAPSILSKALATDARNPSTFYVFNNPSTATELPNLASSYLSRETGDAFFILAYTSTELLLIKQTVEGQASSEELKGESLMPRFLSGLAEKFRQKNSDGDYIVSVLIQVLDGEIYVLTLTRDGHLKFWSTSNGQCVAVINILAETGDILKDRVQGAILKTSVDSRESECILAVFMSFSSDCLFHIIKPIVTDQQIKIVRLKTLRSVEDDLIDFSLQKNRLWSAWRSEDGDCAIYTASLQSASWIPVAKEPLPEPDLKTSDGESDPKQLYLQHIFHPGKFPLSVISKALSIYRRSTVLSETNVSVGALKQSVCVAVENEIQSLLSENVVNDQEYLECAEWCWQNFYSRCVQYHTASLKPLGLMLLPSVSGAVLLKKSTFSFLRPVEPLEHMVLCSEFMYRDQFVNFAMIGEDPDLIDDIMTLFEVIVYLDRQLSDAFSSTFEKELSLTLSPNVMADMIDKMKIDMDSELRYISTHISNVLSQCNDLYKAIHKVLEMLRQDSTLSHPDNEINPGAMYHFSSRLGVSLVASSLMQQSRIRFGICRNLLFICNVLVDIRELEPSVFESVHSICRPETVVLTQAHYIMLWLSNLPALVDLPHEATLQRLTPIKLTPVYNLRPSNSCVSLLELFAASAGGHEARKSFARVDCDDETLAQWHVSLLGFVSHLRQIACPLKEGTVLAEWLLTSGQNLWLQQYVRLLSSWCDWNICSCNFLLAASFLTSGENYKALDLFQGAAIGVFRERFLHEKIAKGLTGNDAYVAYHLKVIQLFELHKARDCAITMANTALIIVEKDSPQSATLYSIKFKHHLALKHFNLAFDALKSNPDTERQKDNLRDLVKTLLDDRKFDVLLKFNYGSMDECFTDILLSRARATDAVNNVFYDFLYAYHIKRGPLCHRLAASVMYEQAFRLFHVASPEALEKQVKCYLAAKNALHLCDSQYAWVVRPADPDEDEKEVLLEPLAGSDGDVEVLRIKKQVEVVDVATIKKELTFASAKLKLTRFDPTSTANVTTPVELVTLLNNAGLFKTALEICTTFNLSYSSVFDTLTKHCVMLQEEEHPSAWDWLVENDLQDLPVNRDSIAEVVWQLLRSYLDKYERENMTCLHKVICKKVIDMRMYIPHWLLASYKLRNPAELLRLLHGSGRIDEAFQVANELILAALGFGKELYGFKTALAPTTSGFCLPVYEVQCLVEELRLQNERNIDRPFEKEYNALKELFTRYLETAVRISNEKCRLELSGMGTIRTPTCL